MSKSKKRIPISEDGTKIYSPKNIVPGFQSYIVENNVQNKCTDTEEQIDAALARKWVNENHK